MKYISVTLSTVAAFSRTRLLCAFCAFTTFSSAEQREPRADWSDEKLAALADEIHASYLTLDSHLDVPIVLRRPEFDISQEHSWEEDASQVDFPRMKKGGIDGGFFTVFVSQGPLTPGGRSRAIETGLDVAKLIHRTIDEHSDLAGLATTREEAEALRAEGKHAIFIGIENGYAIGRNIELLQDYYDLGVRYLGVTHFRNNDLADSSTDSSGALHNGLSALGLAAMEECNRLGIMIDVSHAADKTVWDILEVSKTPIIASHSGCYACYPHPRNLNDALLIEIANLGGVVQMNMFSAYMMKVQPDEQRSNAMIKWFQEYRGGVELTPEQQRESIARRVAIEKQYPKPLSTVAEVVDHIDHMVNLIGIDHVGISGDFDGGGGVEGAMDVGQMKNITIEMLKRGYSEEDLKKFWGGNLMRVLDTCQEYAASLASPDE